MEWFSTWFDTPYYHLLYKNRDYQEAEFFIQNLVTQLQFQPQSKILDLACGKGRHSIFLNNLGFEVLGMDLSQNSINAAKNNENTTLKFKVGDMRESYFPNEFGVILNLFTSFGYFEDKKDNEKIFQAISSQLITNGIFVIDYLNPNYIISQLKEKETKIIENISFEISKKIENDFIIKNIEFTDKGKSFQYQEKVQLFHYYNFIDMAEAVDLELISLYGNYNLEDFNEELSPRTILSFKKNGK